LMTLKYIEALLILKD